MISFDITKMRSRYVYITKITHSYIHVVSHRNGTDFVGNNLTRKTVGDHTVTLVPINRYVCAQYQKYNRTSVFPRPVLAALNYYGDVIVSLEVQRLNYYTKSMLAPENWQSIYSLSIKKLEPFVKDRGEKNGFLNGQYIYFVDPERRIDLKGAEGFGLTPAVAFDLSQMGFDVDARKLNLQTEIAKDLSVDDTPGEDKEGDSHPKDVRESSLRPRDVIVLSYRPDPEDDNGESITVYGAVATGSLDDKALLHSFYAVTADDSFASCASVLKASKIVSAHYGHEAAEFLCLEQLCFMLGTPCPANLDQRYLNASPSHIPAAVLTAWLLGFLHRESDLKVLREINMLLTRALKFGISKVLSFEDIYVCPEKGFDRSVIRENPPYAVAS